MPTKTPYQRNPILYERCEKVDYVTCSTCANCRLDEPGYIRGYCDSIEEFVGIDEETDCTDWSER